jgi:putative SOS response-associated peptidase YedK
MLRGPWAECAAVAVFEVLLAPNPSDGMICWTVSPRVGSVKNNDPSWVEPINLPWARGAADCGGA